MLGALLFALVFLAGLFAGKATRAAWESQPACWTPGGGVGSRNVGVAEQCPRIGRNIN
jgi:hypothetical protein